MQVIALYSNKGGVGKTAAAVNLAYLAAESGVRTLLCDLDPQGAATFCFRVKPKLKKAARGLLDPGEAVAASIKGTDFQNLDLLPADFSHRNLDLAFSGVKRSDERLRRVLRPLRKEYDLVVLDSPPTINILAEAIFRAADALLVPVTPTTLSVRTLEQLLEFLDDAGYRRSQVHCFFSMVDRRKKLHRELAADVRSRFANVLQSAIPHLSTVEQMGVHREPTPVYAPHSEASQAYRALWDEVDSILAGRGQQQL